jgi:hypothetical protein
MGRSAGGPRGAAAVSGPRAAQGPAAVRARSGAVAGVASTVGFAVIHDLLISDIWQMLPIMALAGALCGLCIAWSYGMVSERASISSWLVYNLAHVGMLGLLGTISIVVFEPITTMAAVIEANESPTALIMTAMPLTVAVALLASATLSAMYGRRWSHHAAIFTTVAVVVLFLGLNVSAIGLVDIPTDATLLIAEIFGLILGLAVLYAAVFIGLERRMLRRLDR